MPSTTFAIYFSTHNHLVLCWQIFPFGECERLYALNKGGYSSWKMINIFKCCLSLPMVRSCRPIDILDFTISTLSQWILKHTLILLWQIVVSIESAPLRLGWDCEVLSAKIWWNNGIEQPKVINKWWMDANFCSKYVLPDHSKNSLKKFIANKIVGTLRILFAYA